MDLAPTEFQELLRSTAQSFVQRDYPIARHRDLMARGETFDADTWQRMAALGWPGLMVAEQYGGTGGTWVDLIVLLEELGKGLLPMTLLAHTLAGLAIARHGTEEQKQRLLPGLVRGQPVTAVAVTEPRGTVDRAGVACTATETGSGF